MNVVVALDFRFQQTPDGQVWTSTVYGHSFWKRYLDEFEKVTIVARAVAVNKPDANDVPVLHKDVAFSPVPFYLGPLQYFARRSKVRRAARGAIGVRNAVILRVGSQIGTCIAPALWRTGRPYGLEVVGDPHEAFAPGAIRHPLRPLFRWHATRAQRQHCARAGAAAYVTKSALQYRYPCPAFTTSVSDIELSPEWWTNASGRPPLGNRLIFVGSLEQMYKGPDVLLDALAAVVRGGMSLELRLIGTGRHLSELQSRAAALGIAGHVRFLGSLPPSAVRDELDQASLFVLPSRTEGLPRAMLEAMARGVPSIGSAVGGIPDLLPSEDLVLPGDAVGLARKIAQVITNPERMSRMSSRNRLLAEQFHDDVLRPRRAAFYRHVAEVTRRWIETQAGSSRQY